MSLRTGTAVLMFLAFAFSYFPSAWVRGVIATLAPQFSTELNLNAANLGLLAGAYFFGFAAMQLPVGSALDRFGPKRVLIAFLAVAVIGSAAFAMSTSFGALTLARALIGMGVSACLMAPMTSFRRNFGPAAQMRANSWMLMTGSLGLVASTLPVQWLLPHLGWRGLFWSVAALLALAMGFIAIFVPTERAVEVDAVANGLKKASGSYAEVFRHPTFIRYLPMGFFQYGAMVALQSLWIGPWLNRVCGWSAQETAMGLFVVNVSMLVTFMSWGVVVPRLYARGWTAEGLIARGIPLNFLVMALGVVLGSDATAWVWALFCVSSTFVSLSQPAVGQAFPAALAGRALSAYNLVIFAGVFILQWGLGATIDALMTAGWRTASAFQGAFAVLGACCVASYLWFLWRDEGRPTRTASVGLQ